MASSDLWENVILTKVYLPQMCYQGVSDRHWYQKGERTILTNVKSICAPMYVMRIGLLWLGNRILPEIEGRDVLHDLIPDVGQLEFAHIALRCYYVHRLGREPCSVS